MGIERIYGAATRPGLSLNIEKSSVGPRLTVLDSPVTVLYFVPPTNKVVGIVRLIILYHPVTGFGLVQRTYRLI